MLSKDELWASASVNWSALLDQVSKDYETPPAKGIAHGLQKDAIQNGWGAKEGRKKWEFAFQLIEAPRQKPLLAMTDGGTTGLIGDIIDYKNLTGQIPTEQRLARFECMFDSGGNVGPGLYGRGKLIFNVASKEKKIYYDSLTNNGLYRFGIRLVKGRECRQFPQVKEGDEAKGMLHKYTKGRLQPLNCPGTRITIVDPIVEVLDSLEDGTFIANIEETWWEIILKYNANISIQISNDTPVHARIPLCFGGLPEKNANKWRVYLRDRESIEIGREKYRIKRFQFLLPPLNHEIPEDLRGINLHRQGMKIGPIKLTGLIPEEIRDRFFGYIWLEPSLESMIAEIEDLTHYGFSSRHRAVYHKLKRVLQGHIDNFMEQLGLKKKGTSPEEETRRLVEDAHDDLNSILSNMGVPGFGAGVQPESGLVLSVEELFFPEDSNYLTFGDVISSFWYRAINNSGDARSVWIDVFTYERDMGVIENILNRQRLDIPANDEYETDLLSIDIKRNIYPRYKKVGCICQLTDRNKHILAKKTFYFYIDVEPETSEKYAEISLRSIQWPRANSRRVDYDQSIRELKYEIENLSILSMDLRMRLRTLRADERNAEIAEIGSWDLTLTPMQSKLIEVPELLITRDDYQEVNRGKINLRCHVVATNNTKLWEKGDYLAKHTISFFLNTEQSYGFFDEKEGFDGGPDALRSEARPIEASRAWKFRYNYTHPVYLDAKKDEIRQKNYLFEEMTKQIVYVLLRNGRFEILRKQAEIEKGSDLEELAPEDLLEKVSFKITDKILAEYYRG